MQITIINGAVEYDGTPVLTEVNFDVREKEKIALVGRNGCGKTTLLKVLTGAVELIPGAGEDKFGYFKSGNPVVGYLEQTATEYDGKTMLAEILDAYGDIIALEKAMDEALQAVQADGSFQNAKKYSALHDEFDRLGGYYYKKEYLTAIKKFGFTNEDAAKPLNEFSGGQRTKIALLKLLLSKPDVLLLDEPTNHLDLQAIEWLEHYLAEYKKSCVIVSHDRMFLDRIVNVVYEIEYGETARYAGNYTAFTQRKKEAYEKAVKDAVMRKKEIDRLQKVVDRFRYKANKAAMAQAKMAQIKRIGEVGMPSSYDMRTFKTAFQPTEETVRETLVAEKLVFGYGKPLGELTMILERGCKLGVIGSNGCGKSTLIRTLMGRQRPLSGYVFFGLHANVGYFDQTLTQSTAAHSVLEDYLSVFPQLTGTEARTDLGAFLFSGDDVFKSVKDLSGGEKVRLALCKIFKRRPNVLVLDEPTNHLDIVGKETLENMLSAYSGTVIVVSHDRYFINRICDRLLVFGGNGVQYYPCGYDEYEKTAVADTEEENTVRAAETVKKEKPVSESKERTKKLHRIAVLEEKIAVIDGKIAELNRGLSENPEIFSDYKKIAETDTELKQLHKEQEPLIEEWTRLSEEVAE